MISKNGKDAEKTFQEARDSIARGDARRGFANLLDALRIDPLHEPSLSAASKAARILGDARGAELFASLHANPGNPQHLYDVGYYLLEMSRADIALSFLEACLDRSPGNDDVRYELGYALFRTRAYKEAAGHLAAAAENLSPERGASAGLLQIGCLLYDGRIDEAEGLIRRLEDELRSLGRGDSLEALELIVRRLRRIEAAKPDSVRLWHFVQHGGVILAESRGVGNAGRFPSLVMNSAAVAAILRLLKTFLKGVGIKPEALLHPDGDSAVLALAAGRILDLPVRPLAQRTGSRELLILADTDALQGIEEDAASCESVESIFCFRLDPLRACPVLPDIAGLMAGVFRFPWQERVEVYKREDGEPAARSVPADERDREALALEIAGLGARLPEDRKMAQIVEFYRMNRDLLVATNREAFPFRRAFTTFSPV